MLDLVTFGCTERLVSVLEEEPRLVERIGNDGATLMAAAEKTGNAAIIEILNRYGATPP